MGTDPRNGFLFSGTPLAVTGGLSAARFTAEPLMEVTTSWVGARWLQVQFLVSFFPETLRGGASPSFWVANFFKHCTGGALCRRHSQCARVLVVVDLKPRPDKSGDR